MSPASHRIGERVIDSPRGETTSKVHGGGSSDQRHCAADRGKASEKVIRDRWNTASTVRRICERFAYHTTKHITHRRTRRTCMCRRHRYSP
ncbi:hypothetical protein Y032_0003g1689 [Ancylostoma ceylanicum]|uniref:Uncharacterized protein n=1 Tax=Ancylostoma ceylanicum TaxID=53326 RepID=A0A016VZ74_9BILA|nr:hypothetical protein Y032_0003g1689 [Ancylostoma ceylanicum]